MKATTVKRLAILIAVLGLAGTFLAEFSFGGAQKIPFTCSYLPGRSHIHLTFWLWIYIVGSGVLVCSAGERRVLESPAATAVLVAGLGLAALAAIVRNNWLAAPSRAELRFEEEPPDRLLDLNLS